MNQALEMLRNKAVAMYDMIAGESAIELIIDPIEEPTVSNRKSIEPTLSKPVHNAELSKNMTDSNNLHANLCIEQLNLMDITGRDGKVWIYNVSPQERTLGNSLIKTLKVPACAPGEEYATVTSFPMVVVQPKVNVDKYETEYFLIDGRRLAMDLINPSNISLDQDQSFDSLSRFAPGTNFSKKGVFFSTHNPPLKKDIKAAHKRLKVYYKDLIDRANIVRITSAASVLGVPTEEVNAAVEYIEGPRTTR